MITTDIKPSLDTVLRPNIELNTDAHWAWPRITVKELDWFTFGDGSEWMKDLDPEPEQAGQNGFDLIVTTDTIYSVPLIQPLIQTLKALSLLSSILPPILLAIENRDPALNNEALEMARQAGFSTKRVAPARVRKAVEGRAKWGWGKDRRKDWEGVEVWKWKLVVQGGGGGEMPLDEDEE